MNFFINSFLSNEQSSSGGHTIIHNLGGVSFLIQALVSILIIDCWSCNDDFRKKPGSIILFYAISALGVSVIGGLEHYTEFAKDICEGVAFYALFFEYNCQYYEIGFIQFFIYDFEELIKDKFKSISEAVSRIPSRDESLIANQDPELDIHPQLQIKSQAANNLSQHEQIEQKFDLLRRTCKEIKEEQAARRRWQKYFDQRLEKAEQLFRKKQHSDHYFSRAFLQTKINVTVICLSLASALVPFLCNHLGPNLFGTCSEEFKSGEVQEMRMGFYIILAAISTTLCVYGLISFLKQQERLQEVTLKPLKDNRNLKEDLEKADHYLKEVFLFIGATTACCLVFCGLNIYADLTVINSNNKEIIPEWNDWKWDSLLILHSFQGGVALFFKLREPMVWGAMEKVYRDRWNGLKEFIKKLFQCHFRLRRKDISPKDSFAGIGINDTEEALLTGR